MFYQKRFVVPVLTWFLLSLLPAQAQNRIALVMGVGDYDGSFGLKRLPGISADLQRMKASLEGVGFRVTVVENPTLVDAEEAIERFGADVAQNNGVALFYFSGHGGEFEGKNYLIPKGARIGKPRDVKEQAVAAQRVLGRMEEAKNKTNIVFLDCCRNDLAKATSDSGMAAMNARGTFIGFATASEDVAQASTAGSPYTICLAKHIPTQGLSITDMHTRVTKEVEEMTSGEGSSGQTPFQYSGLTDVFYFVPGNGVAVPVPTPVPDAESGRPPPPPPPAPRLQPDDSGLRSFFTRWWDHQGSDEAAVWASDFQSPCDYSYKSGGPANRAFIIDDRRKFINRYDRRIYTLLADPTYNLAGDTATLIVRYHYRYNGKKTTQGRVQCTLGLVRDSGGGWLIASFDEDVERGEVLPGSGGSHGGGDRPVPAAGAAEALSAFVQNWWDHQSSDSASVWASDFRNPCNYCYGEGRSSRSFIENDRQKLLNRYTTRVLRAVTQPDVSLGEGGTTATVNMTYSYAYSGAKNASGTATINLSLSWDGNTWGITRYNEKTRRK